MRHHKVARQPRAAVTGPGAKACVAAASAPQDHSTEASVPRRARSPESSSTTTEPPATEAEILLGTAMWLDRVRGWLGDCLDRPGAAEGGPSETVALRRADLEAFRNGLGRAVSLLDRLTVDPAQLPPLAGPGAPLDTASTTGRTVH